MFVIEANLDCESRWASLPPSKPVLERISYYGLLLSALAPADAEVEIWTPGEVDLARWHGRPLVSRVGTPPRADLTWANRSAKAANDRRLAHAVLAALGHPLAGSRSIPEPSNEPIDDPTARAAALHFSRKASSSWVAKAAWSAAGRDRVRGAGQPTTEQQTRLERLLAAAGALVVEPWCDRIFDLGVCATVDRDGHVAAEAPHSLLVDHNGRFNGIDLERPKLDAGERALLDRAVQAAGAAIAGVGYVGPFAVDAFVYRDGGVRKLHPICEINARHTFGWVTRAARRDNWRRLGFGPDPGDGKVLISDWGDGVTAWVA